MAGLVTELLFEISVNMEPPQVVGATPNGDRRVRLITGGRFAGPKLQGEVLPEAGTGSCCGRTARGPSTSD
jgi:hypothetical protein